MCVSLSPRWAAGMQRLHGAAMSIALETPCLTDAVSQELLGGQEFRCYTAVRVVQCVRQLFRRGRAICARRGRGACAQTFGAGRARAQRPWWRTRDAGVGARARPHREPRRGTAPGNCALVRSAAAAIPMVSVS